MKRLAWLAVAVVVVLAAGCHRVVVPGAGSGGAPRIQVYFSPNGGCTDAIVRELGSAQREVLIQAYSFTSKPIAQAVVDARKRGVKVNAILDRSNETGRYSAATFLSHAGVPTLIDSEHAIAHNKIMVIDEATVITGSFNFTNAAEKSNAENLLVIKGAPELVSAYRRNFEAHAAHSEAYSESARGRSQRTRR